MLVNVYTSYTQKCIGSGIQNTGKPNKLLCHECVYTWLPKWCHDIHVTIWLKCYPQNFCGVGSICESNIFMLKSQT